MTKADFDACFMGPILNITKIVPQASFCGILLFSQVLSVQNAAFLASIKNCS